MRQHLSQGYSPQSPPIQREKAPKPIGPQGEKDAGARVVRGLRMHGRGKISIKGKAVKYVDHPLFRTFSLLENLGVVPRHYKRAGACMNGTRIALALPALGLWACLDRNYENPCLSDSTPYTTAPQPPAGQVDTAKPDADTVKPTEPPREDAEIFEEDVSVSPIILTVGDPPVGP